MLHSRLRAAAGNRGAGDPLAGYVTSLLRFNGTDGATTFTDDAGVVWTAEGNAQIDTSWSQFGSGSLLLDGSGDSLRGPLSIVDWSQPFTIETFVRPGSLASIGTIFGTRHDFQAANGGGANGCALRLNTNGTLRFFAWDPNRNFFIDITTTQQLAVGAWYHVALNRSASGEYRLYVGGALGASATTAAVVSQPPAGNYFYLGTHNEFANYYNGHYDAWRVTVGASRYDDSCTVPTEEYPAI